MVDVVQFSHPDVMTLGGFAGLGGIVLVSALGLTGNAFALIAMLISAFVVVGIVGALIGRYLVLPLKGSSPDQCIADYLDDRNCDSRSVADFCSWRL